MTYRITKRQHANLIEARDVMWPSVPPENVQPGLARWRSDFAEAPPDCGTVACFGGWCAWWPAFRAQGVWAAECSGAPRVGSEHSACEYLFGIPGLFAFRPRGAGEDPSITDHEFVTWRLNQVLNNCEVIDDSI